MPPSPHLPNEDNSCDMAKWLCQRVWGAGLTPQVARHTWVSGGVTLRACTRVALGTHLGFRMDAAPVSERACGPAHIPGWEPMPFGVPCLSTNLYWPPLNMAFSTSQPSKAK